MKRILFLLVCLVTLGSSEAVAQGREMIPLSQWLFSQDGATWEEVTIPHDWAIAGPFDKKWDLQTVAIVQNGEQEATEKSGRSGALPWIGQGFYKTWVTLSEPIEHTILCFDGAMSEPTVYVNGSEAGGWKYGYNAFRVDATPFMHAGENEIEVRLVNLEESSRWYPGAGLYRPVQLLVNGKKHIRDLNTFIYTTDLYDDAATLALEAATIHTEPDDALAIDIYDSDGNCVYSDLQQGDIDEITRTITITNAHLWSPETPYLYTLCLQVLTGDTVLDEQLTTFGIRTVTVSADGGFQLNGQSRKLHGVCLHHDLGPLGAAVNKAALIRQVKILKDMGCDAIRTAHNMPSTMQLEVYDSLGMMVMAESFDMWRYPKCKNGYARFFDDWAEQDISNLVLYHRNSPSVVMWSIGNEIPEQGSAEGVELAQKLQDICHELDPSRPVTQGMDQVRNALNSGFAQVMDIPGLNYRDHEYLNAYNTLSHGFLLGSETASTVSSRGIYKFPAELSSNAVYDDGQCSSYDLEYCWWSNVPDVDFAMQDDYPWTIGQFVWTGFDYLGEPTPYDEYWPSRSSYFGICDLAGLPKDRYYLYRSQWNTTSHTVHLLPHWTWPGREGEVTPVYCYTDGVEGELFVNGVSQGRVRKDTTRHIQDISPDSVNSQPLLDRYRLRWNDVVYEPGEIRVVVYDDDGNIVGEDRHRTAGEPAAIHVTCDRPYLTQADDDLVFLTISLIDANGVEIPIATDDISVVVSFPGTLRGLCNGDATSLESFSNSHMHLFSGKLVAVVGGATTSTGQYGMSVVDAIHVYINDINRFLQATYDIPVR